MRESRKCSLELLVEFFVDSVLVVLVAGLGLARSISGSRGEAARQVINNRGRVGSGTYKRSSRVLKCWFGC